MTKARNLLSLILLTAATTASAQLNYEVSAIANASSGEYAPYLIGSLSGERHTMKNSVMLDAAVYRPMDYSKRFSWSFGAELMAGEMRCSKYNKTLKPTAAMDFRQEFEARVQQLYAAVKYRSVFLSVGMKDQLSPILNPHLSSGDFVESGNARAIPQARAGFIDFVDIPLTQGWVQINGEVSYGMMFDGEWQKEHFNYYTGVINTHRLFTYKRCFFRSKPSEPLCVTAGMQIGAMFGGRSVTYSQGTVTRDHKNSTSALAFLKMLLPIEGNGDDFYEGNTLGSWDCRVRYRLRSGDEISAYIQWPWDDGSGIGRFNKLDGVWGLEYRPKNLPWLKAVLIEYVDFRDQSGPIHWDPDDNAGSGITTRAEGNDDYYNNFYYPSYMNYGMSIGTPFLLSPIYNNDGYLNFACTRTNGMHFGAEGAITPEVDYRVLFSYQRGLGNYRDPYHTPRENTSMMIQAGWNARTLIDGLKLSAAVGFDAGKLRGDNIGCLITVSYSR